MSPLEHRQAIRIVIATIGMQDPISSVTGKPMAALTLCLKHEPQRVYLIPTAKHLPSSSYENAEETKAVIIARLSETHVEILPIEVSDPADLSKLLPDMERILRTIKNKAQDIPNPRFIVSATSGMPTMRDALIQLLSLGLLGNVEVYDVLDPRFVPEEQRIRRLPLPLRPKVALFVDHENMFHHIKFTSEVPELLKRAAAKMGSLEEAWVVATASGWRSKGRKTELAYAESGVTPVTSPERTESADLRLLHLLGRQPNINIYIIVTSDGGFAHSIALLLGQGKKVIVWLPGKDVANEFRTLKTYYPNFSLQKLNAVLSAARSTPKPVPIVTSNVIITGRNAKSLLSAACLIRLEGLKEWIALWGLKQFKEYSPEDINHIDHIYLLIESALSSPSLAEFFEGIKKYPEVKLTLVNITKEHDGKFPSHPNWTVLSDPGATSCAQLLARSYTGRADSQTEIWAKAATADPGQEGAELRYLAQLACTKGSEQALTFLRELVLR